MSQAIPAIDGERVSYVVHELRSPLAIVRGYTSFLLDEGAGALEPQQREVLDRVRRSLAALERSLADVAEFARTLVTSCSEIAAEEVELRSVLEEAADLCELLGAGAEQSLEGLRVGAALSVAGDPLAVRQCVLAVAAWIARGSTGGRITARVVPDPAELRLEWRSSGVQMPDDLAAALRDPLAPVPGLGNAAAWRLGLAAAAARMAAMGGALDLSRDGEDLVVTLRFRVSPAG